MKAATRTVALLCIAVLAAAGCTVYARPAPVVVGPAPVVQGDVVYNGVMIAPGTVVVAPPPLCCDPFGMAFIVGSQAYIIAYEGRYHHRFVDRWYSYGGRWQGRGYGHPDYVRVPPGHPAHPRYRR